MTKTAAKSILLVDDHAIVREGYRALLAKQPDLQVIAEADNAMLAYQLFKESQPDLIMTDISLQGISGFEVIGRIRQRCPEAKILVFSMHKNASFAIQAMHAGALAYVTKNSSPELLLQAIAEVLAGRLFLSPDIAQAIALETIGCEQMALASLTTREFEILHLLLETHSHQTIAQSLNISEKTVCNSHYLIKRKLGVNNDIALTRLAIKLKVLKMDKHE